MAFINVESGLRGIDALFTFDPIVAKSLQSVVQEILRDNSGLNKGERELIATYVSHLNKSQYCALSHGAVAQNAFKGGYETVKKIISDPDLAQISEKLKKLMKIALIVTTDVKGMSEDVVDEAKAAGASDKDIHDTVLIASTFCMFNRYIDGLGIASPNNIEEYVEEGRYLFENGYLHDNSMLNT